MEGLIESTIISIPTEQPAIIALKSLLDAEFHLPGKPVRCNNLIFQETVQGTNS